MDKPDSHIPINLRHWLDEQIARERTDCAPVGFHGLLTALTQKTAEEAVSSLEDTKVPGRD